MEKQNLEKKKKELEEEFDRLNKSRQDLFNLANQQLEKMLELKGAYKTIDEMLKEKENLSKEENK